MSQHWEPIAEFCGGLHNCHAYLLDGLEEQLHLLLDSILIIDIALGILQHPAPKTRC